MVNINTTQGRKIFDQLIQSADIVLINASDRQIKPLGLDHKTLQALNPGVLFCRLDCFGGPRRGPKTDYIGYDDIIQANSGIMSRFGGAETPEEHAHLGTLDVNCGFAAGLGMTISLYHQLKTGKATRARTSLSAATNLLQIPFTFDYKNRGPFNEASGRDVLGNNPLSHFYQTADSWIFLDSSTDELDQLKKINGLEFIESAPDINQYLSNSLKLLPTAHWVEVFQKANIAAAAPMAIETLRNENSRPADNTPGTDKGSFAFSIYKDHPSGHCLTKIDPYSIRPTEGLIREPNGAERHGASTKQVLKQLGYNDAEIAQMVKEGVAGLGWGKEFLPS